jgi:hypothetical protein
VASLFLVVILGFVNTSVIRMDIAGFIILFVVLVECSISKGLCGSGGIFLLLSPVEE